MYKQFRLTGKALAIAAVSTLAMAPALAAESEKEQTEEGSGETSAKGKRKSGKTWKILAGAAVGIGGGIAIATGGSGGSATTASDDDATSDTGDDTSGTGDDTSDTDDDTSGTGDDTSDTGDDTSDTGDDTSDTGDDTSGTGDDTSDTGDDTPTPLELTVDGVGATLALGESGISATATEFEITGTTLDDADTEEYTNELTFTSANGAITASLYSGDDAEVALAGGTAIMSESTVTASTDSAIAEGSGIVRVFDYGAALEYTTFGLWEIAEDEEAIATYAGVFAGAPEVALTGDMPATGSASYAGNAVGYVVDPATSSESGQAGRFYGDATLTADFAENSVTGSISNNVVYGVGDGEETVALGAMNDITLAATISGSSYSGTATAEAASEPMFDITGATGTVDGAFYGDGAAETSGAFVLEGGDNGVTVIGSFGAAQTAE